MTDKGKASTGNAAAWTIASRAGAQAAQLTVFLVAARRLSPENFGVFSLFFALTVLLTQLVRLGWAEFIASWEGAEQVDAQAFTLAATGGLIAASLGSLGAAIMVAFPDAAPYAALQLMLSLSLLGTGATTVLEGRLLRTGRGSALAKLLLLAELVGSAAAVLGLLGGWDVTALGVGKLVRSVVFTVGSAATARWFPKLRIRGPGTQTIVAFSKNLLVSKLTGYSQQYTATLALGLFLGPHAVGLYRAAERVVGAVYEFVREPARVVCWMTLRRAFESTPHEPAERGHALARETERFITVLMLFAAPVLLGLATVSSSILVALLGERWVAAAPVVSVLAVGKLITAPSIATLPLFSLRQQSRQVLRLSLVTGVATVLALPLFAPFGLGSAATGQLLASVVSMLVIGQAFSSAAEVQWLRAILLAFPSLIASAVMLASLSAFQRLGAGFATDIRLQLATEVAVGALVFLLPFTFLGGWRRLGGIRLAS